MKSVPACSTKFVITITLILLLLTFAFGCSQDREHRVTFQQLFSNPDQYDGKEISLEGFFFHGFEIVVLSEGLGYSEFTQGHLVPKGRMIWIEGKISQNIYDELYKQEMMGPEERFGKVRVSGKFEYGEKYGHLGNYSSQIIPSTIVIVPWSPPTIETTQDAAASTAR